MAKKLTSTNNDVVDISLSSIRKKRFRIDGDDSRILELDTSDLSILSRIREAYPKLQELNDKAVSDWAHRDNEDYNATVDILTNIDSEMRKLIDYIFDTNASELCAPTGTMYDPIGGQFRFEHIITTLSALYETNINSEVKQMSERVQKYTNKYTGK